MDKITKKIYYNSIKKPVWITEKQRGRRLKTPSTYRFGKSWEGSSGMSMELLKMFRNKGIDIEKALLTERGFAGLHIY